MTKTISIADDVYEQLMRIKGDRSFSKVIGMPIKKKENTELIVMAFGTRNEKEVIKRKGDLKSKGRLKARDLFIASSQWPAQRNSSQTI